MQQVSRGLDGSILRIENKRACARSFGIPGEKLPFGNDPSPFVRPAIVLLLDCDSYFASIEQHLDPALRGRLVGVVPVMAETSCCIAAS